MLSFIYTLCSWRKVMVFPFNEKSEAIQVRVNFMANKIKFTWLRSVIISVHTCTSCVYERWCLGLSSKLRIAFNLQLNMSNTGNWNLTFCLRDVEHRVLCFFLTEFGALKILRSFYGSWVVNQITNDVLFHNKSEISTSTTTLYSVVEIRSSSHHWEKANKVFENCFKRKHWIINWISFAAAICVAFNRFKWIPFRMSGFYQENDSIRLCEHFTQPEWNAVWVKWFYEQKTQSVSTQMQNE